MNWGNTRVVVTGVASFIGSHLVEAVNAGRTPVLETGLGDLIASNRQRLRATLSPQEAVLNSDVTFVVVPTPSNALGAFSLEYVADAFQAIGRALAEKTGYHLAVLTSTVLPGSTRNGLLPILERHLSKACGEDFGLCTSPEFIALGSVIHDFLNPEFNLIGEHDVRAGKLLAACFPRDNLALEYIVRALGTSAELAAATNRVNRAWPEKWAEQVRSLARNRDTVAVLDLAYKPATHVIEESQSIELARTLAAMGLRVVSFDPIAGNSARAELRVQALILDSLSECLAQARIVLITTPDPEFCALTASDFSQVRGQPVVVIDFWRLLKKQLSNQPNIHYLAVGHGTEDAANAVRLRAIWGPGRPLT